MSAAAREHALAESAVRLLRDGKIGADASMETLRSDAFEALKANGSIRAIRDQVGFTVNRFLEYAGSVDRHTQQQALTEVERSTVMREIDGRIEHMIRTDAAIDEAVKKSVTLAIQGSKKAKAEQQERALAERLRREAAAKSAKEKAAAAKAAAAAARTASAASAAKGARGPAHASAGILEGILASRKPAVAGGSGSAHAAAPKAAPVSRLALGSKPKPKPTPTQKPTPKPAAVAGKTGSAPDDGGGKGRAGPPPAAAAPKKVAAADTAATAGYYSDSDVSSVHSSDLSDGSSDGEAELKPPMRSKKKAKSPSVRKPKPKPTAHAKRRREASPADDLDGAGAAVPDISNPGRSQRKRKKTAKATEAEADEAYAQQAASRTAAAAATKPPKRPKPAATAAVPTPAAKKPKLKGGGHGTVKVGPAAAPAVAEETPKSVGPAEGGAELVIDAGGGEAAAAAGESAGPEYITDGWESHVAAKFKLEAKDPKTGSWYPAQVVKVDAAKRRARIHFDGWNKRHDFWCEYGQPVVRIDRSKLPSAK